jgi:hypothetical protein
MKRRILMTGLLLLLPSGVALSQTPPPDYINYQGVLRNSSDDPLTGVYDMVFRFYDASILGTLLLTDGHVGTDDGVTVSGGLFNVQLGSGSITAGAASNLTEVFAIRSEVWLEIQVGAETLDPRVRIVSAGYALNAGFLAGSPPSYFLDQSANDQWKGGRLVIDPPEGTVRLGHTQSTEEYGIWVEGNFAGIHVKDAGDSGRAWIGYANRGIEASGTESGGLFYDADGSGQAWLGYGSRGIEAWGNQAGAFFQDANGTGRASLGEGDTGIRAYGIESGGYFFDSDSSGAAYVGHGDRGVQASGTEYAGYFSGNVTVTGDFAASFVQADTVEATSGGVHFPDGSVQTSAAIIRNIISTLDAQNEVGLDTSIAIGNDGNPVISYYSRAPNYDLMMARCTDPSCLAVSVNTVDSAGNVGRYTSIAIGNDGNPVISYLDVTNQDLKVAHCTGPSCAGAAITTVDAAGDVGGWTSIAIGYDNNPVVSYHDITNDDLKVARCTDPGCADATLATLDSTGDVGRYTSITVGPDNIPVISYYDATNSDLKVAKCTGPGCYSAELNTVDSTGSVGQFTSIAIGSDGNPVISHHSSTPDFTLKVSHCTTYNCGVATTHTLDDTGDVGSVGTYTSIAVGGDGNPIISYFDDYNDDLKVAHCNDPGCSSATLSTLDSPGGVGRYTSIAVGSDGRAVVSYYDHTNEDLKIITHVVGPVGSPRIPLGGRDHRPGVPGEVGGGTEAAGHARDVASSCAVMRLKAAGCGAENVLRGHGLLRDDHGNVYARSFRSSATDLASIVRVVGPVESGDVLVIDADRPGLMSLARQPADSAVFGVVAGEPGVVLSAHPPDEGHDEGAELESGDSSAPGVGADPRAAVVRAPVAVSGIVTCKVDAGFGPILPGDLLTTSPTPGHAMLAYEPLPGTILGKALEPLDGGTGSIRVLVMLR